MNQEFIDWVDITEEPKDFQTNGNSNKLFYFSNSKTASAMVSAWSCIQISYFHHFWEFFECLKGRFVFRMCKKINKKMGKIYIWLIIYK